MSSITSGRTHTHTHARTHAQHAVDQGQSHGKHQCLHAKDSLREKEEMTSTLGEGTERHAITEA